MSDTFVMFDYYSSTIEVGELTRSWSSEKRLKSHRRMTKKIIWICEDKNVSFSVQVINIHWESCTQIWKGGGRPSIQKHNPLLSVHITGFGTESFFFFLDGNDFKKLEKKMTPMMWFLQINFRPDVAIMG